MRCTCLLVAATLVGVASGCDDEGRLLVVIGSDFVVPREMSVIRATVSGPEGTPEPRTFQLVATGTATPMSASYEIPLSFVVVPRDGDESRSARVVIEGFAVSETDPTPLVVARRNVTGFVSGRTSLLPIFLRRACAGVTCRDDQTCEQGECVEARVEGGSLRAATDEAAERRAIDELADAGPRDAGPLAPRDAGTLMPRDAGPLGPPDASIVRASAIGDDQLQTVWAVVPVPELLGDVFVAGSYDGMLTATAPMSAGGKDAFVGRFREDGSVMWVQTLNGPGDEEFRSIALHGSPAETIVAGYTTSTGATWMFDAPIEPGLVVCKFGGDGALGFGGVMPVPTIFDDLLLGDSVSVGPSVAMGTSEFFLVWGAPGITVGGTILGSTGVPRGFIAALHPEGMGTSGMSGRPQVDDVLELPTSRVTFDYSRMRTVVFDPADASLFVGGLEGVFSTSQNAYVAKVTYEEVGRTLDAVWETPDFLSSGTLNETRGLAVAETGIYAAGIFSDPLMAEDGFLVELHKVSGTFSVPVVFGGNHEQLPYALAIDADGRLWVGGGFLTGIGFPTLGGFVRSSMGFKDMFLASFSPIGMPLAAWVYPESASTGDDIIRSIAFVNGTRTGYIAGALSDPYTFPGTTMMVGVGNGDGFVARFDY